MSINPYSERSDRVVMSVILINSVIIFLDVIVDSMVSDNNDDLIKRIDKLEKKIDQLLEERQGR